MQLDPSYVSRENLYYKEYCATSVGICVNEVILCCIICVVLYESDLVEVSINNETGEIV